MPPGADSQTRGKSTRTVAARRECITGSQDTSLHLHSALRYEKLELRRGLMLVRKTMEPPTPTPPPAAADPSSAEPSAHIRGKPKKKVWLTESYELQSKTIWPGRGQHLLGQYDEDTMVVYQAYKGSIAEYAVANKKFEGCPGYKCALHRDRSSCRECLFSDRTRSMTRMTWIKTNFLWMMFRSKCVTRFRTISHLMSSPCKRVTHAHAHTTYVTTKDGDANLTKTTCSRSG